MVSPAIAADHPNKLNGAVFDRLRNACWVQFVPVRAKMYAAPEVW